MGMSASRQGWWKRPLVWRRVSQTFFLLLFLYLVFRGHGDPAETEGWRLRSTLNPDIVFLANPLTWILTVLASRSLIEKSIWLLVGFLGLTLLLGRVFCGWVCPLGTLIDGAGRLLRPAKVELALARQAEREGQPALRLPALISHRTKYYLLVIFTLLALGGANAVGWFDPLAILMRATSFALAPLSHWWLVTVADVGEAYAPLAGVTRSTRVWLERTFFPATPHFYAQGALHLGILIVVLGLTRLHRRWWCQYLCPLGAFYGLIARVAPLRRWVLGSTCNECGICGNTCRMEAVHGHEPTQVDQSECLRCMECSERCPRGGIQFSFTPPAASAGAVSDVKPLDLGRRGLLTALGASVVALPIIKMWPLRRTPIAAMGTDVLQDEWLLRPPGARPEPEFLRRCIRCGECFRVCPQNALHPALLEAGPEGIWTPRVVPRLGYCEPSCTLCSQVCPTTAIMPLLPQAKRQGVRIGVATVDRNRCLAWNDREECGVCEEVCPVTPKAIELRRGGSGRGRGATERVPAPEVIADRCIGCGICENKCPVEGAAAIRVHRRGESRHHQA